ncbi:MAG: MotA/TolQ/ExbB proton channel family protein [Candidatus Eisenbacteria bacterium]|jgi:biopolymer transport protein ExbB|nr:MotA/TolQ/ExbB proton channel family protein [Candidatus Eisenbacteria bacterium]
MRVVVAGAAFALVLGLAAVALAQAPGDVPGTGGETEALGLPVVDTLALEPPPQEGRIMVKRGFIAELWRKGGPVMWALLANSVLGSALVVERLMALRRSKVLPPSFLKNVRARWLSGDVKGAFDLCTESDLSVARVLKAGLAKHNRGVAEVERAIESTGGHEIQALNKHLRTLGALASIAPLLGILGTVTGMIKAFNSIAVSGSRRPDLIASGISEALITTAAGLVIGIPLFVIYHYLMGRADQRAWEMEEVATDIIENLSLRSDGIEV